MKPRYLLFRADGAPSSRRAIAVMVLCASLLTLLAVQKVSARHEVVRLGYDLSRANEEVRMLREATRRLELERATLTNPERIHTLAAAMGMAPAAADAIRLVYPESATTAAADSTVATPGRGAP